MKLNLSNEWLARWAAKEERCEVSTGHVDVERFHAAARHEQQRAEHVLPFEVDGTHTAFGRLINLWRRKAGIRLDQLAERADVAIEELIAIEHDVRYVPEPRTVYCLARTLGVSNDRLLQLSGNVVARDSRLDAQAVRFAARADSLEKLNRDEQLALEEFVKYLSESK